MVVVPPLLLPAGCIGVLAALAALVHWCTGVCEARTMVAWERGTLPRPATYMLSSPNLTRLITKSIQKSEQTTVEDGISVMQLSNTF